MQGSGKRRLIVDVLNNFIPPFGAACDVLLQLGSHGIIAFERFLARLLDGADRGLVHKLAYQGMQGIDHDLFRWWLPWRHRDHGILQLVEINRGSWPQVMRGWQSSTPTGRQATPIALRP